MQEVEAALPVDGYLCGCGTYLEIQGKKVLHHVIGRERRLELQKSILAHDLDGILEGPEGCAVQSQVSRLEEMERVKELFIKVVWSIRGTGRRKRRSLINSVFWQMKRVMWTDS